VCCDGVLRQTQPCHTPEASCMPAHPLTECVSLPCRCCCRCLYMLLSCCCPQEEELMAKRRQELMAEEGYWAQRMAEDQQVSSRRSTVGSALSALSSTQIFLYLSVVSADTLAMPCAVLCLSPPSKRSLPCLSPSATWVWPPSAAAAARPPAAATPAAAAAAAAAGRAAARHMSATATAAATRAR
jgi:hypothetical protein